jgi:acetyl-CoA carboxylase biotin carboxylase subunit
MFKSLLIANRGEIACRIIGTARRLGISTIAVYSEVDAGALHVTLADQALLIGPAPARESYLNTDAILAAARASGAEAIHPGYGFLSENAEFAEACAAANIVFVGPPPAAIRAMGLKDRAKALMAKAGVAVVPGYLGENQSAKRLAAEADKIGYPVLIKAIAGGGGKGMRRVDSTKEFSAALESARREALNAFGDDRMLIEKFVTRPRHIEVQVFADRHGNVVHLFERDCSLQRRHQKVIEEAPAPGMTEQMREALGDAAVKAARAVGYVGAGTVEFIADASEGLKPDRFWFMEMNTRLQVEHPVTEAITGTDLVEWQLRVAAGEKLPKTQSRISTDGHAIEARLYAEDPRHGFLPSTGKLERLKFPEGVRVDSGVREGDAVTMFYDPMIAKVIAHDATRERAIEKLSDALATVEIAGVRTNNAFLIRALRDTEFVSGRIDTSLLERRNETLIDGGKPPSEILAAAAHFVARERRCEGDAFGFDPWSANDGFRLAGPSAQVIEFVVDGQRVTTSANDADPRIDSALRLESGAIAIIRDGETFEIREYDPLANAEAEGEAAERIVAPMPGKVTRVLVKDGERVGRGQALAVLEAMKMEHTLAAPTDLEIESVAVAAGDQVAEGTIIVRFKQDGRAA